MERTHYPIQQSSRESWDEIFDIQSPITLESFLTGNLAIPKSVAINLNHPKAKGIENDTIEIPVLAHLVRHEKFGDYLIDSGLDSSYQQYPYGKMKGVFAKIFLGKSYQDEGQDIFSRLQKMNVQLQGVFLTHLHFDHRAGVSDLPKNIRYVVGNNEPYQNIRFLFYGNHLQGINTLYEIDFSRANSIHPLGECADIFGDGSLWAISTPGHSKGHMSFLINCYKNPILITGDACFLQFTLKNGIGPGSFSSSIRDAQKSLDKIVEFTRMYPDVKVICGHEIP